MKNLLRTSSPILAMLPSFFGLLGCSSTGQNQLVRGPFAIGYTLERDYRLNLYNPNANGQLIGTHTTSYFKITCQGKPVVIKNKEGQKVKIWQAWFLTDAPKPAILAISNGIYLITDDNGQARVTPVVDEGLELSTFQWLDSEQGQPGRATSSVPTDNAKSSRFLSGGRYLLINESSVLDVHTLAVHPVDLISNAVTRRLGGFMPAGSRSSKLVSFSPGKTQLVFLGSYYNIQRDKLEYALLAIDFVKNRVYAVPFRSSATHFIWGEDATPDWVATYFDWTVNQQGEEVLSIHPYTHYPLWHGHWAQNPGEGQPIRYEVKPVLPIMFDHFMRWAKEQYPTIEPTIKRYEGLISAEFAVAGSTFNLYVRDDYKSLSLESTNQVLLKTIGDQFDQALRNGRFQDGFGKMDPD